MNTRCTYPQIYQEGEEQLGKEVKAADQPAGVSCDIGRSCDVNVLNEMNFTFSGRGWVCVYVCVSRGSTKTIF